MNYYNEYDPKAAAWLRELIAAKLIPAGVVDERSITEISPHDLSDFTQCHFFAGIGGWSLALQLAGWPATRPVWSGSCPCQPFSAAGKQKAQSDARHLWPAFFALIRECGPVHVFGEQVASAIGHGWLDGISEDLESEGYACGAVVLGAHSVCAPHIRQRLYWMADRQREGLEGLAGHGDDRHEPGRIGADATGSTAEGGPTLRMANATSGAGAQHVGEPGGGSRREAGPHNAAECGGDNEGLGNPASGGCGVMRNEAQPGCCGHAVSPGWSRFEIVHCRDGKARRFEPGSFPLAHGLPGRVGLLRGYGNAIVPQVAAEFVAAYLDLSESND